jgi:hypothetical protein
MKERERKQGNKETRKQIQGRERERESSEKARESWRKKYECEVSDRKHIITFFCKDNLESGKKESLPNILVHF